MPVSPYPSKAGTHQIGDVDRQLGLESSRKQKENGPLGMEYPVIPSHRSDLLDARPARVCEKAAAAKRSAAMAVKDRISTTHRHLYVGFARI